MYDLIINNIGMLATSSGVSPKKGSEQKDVKVIENASIGIKDGIVAYVGECTHNKDAKTVLDAKKCLVTPGLVDAHTHLVFGGFREYEIPLKLSGASYLEILAAGGGILSTVKHTRETSKNDLYNKAYNFLDDMLKHGTTTVEAKSGYGLNLETELKQLEIVKSLNEKHNVDLVSTFMGAHAIPLEYKDRKEDFIKLLCEEIIPKVGTLKLAEFCDIFCETGIFTAEESEVILKVAQRYGMRSKIHADEINPIGGSSLAGRIKAISAEHLIEADRAGMESMASGGTIAVLLPATSFYLAKNFAKAKEMIALSIPVAIASDFNPGSSPSFNMQFVMNLGYLKYGLTPEEVLTAVTINSACAIGRGESVGTIEVGKQADIIIWDAPNLNYIFYRFGNNLVDKVIKKGKLVVDNKK